MPHYSRGHRRNPPSLQDGLSASSASVQSAAVLAEQALADAGVRHLFCGGIAVAAHGYVRATKDVDFLVGEEAFHRRGALVFPRSDVPVEVNGVLVDLVTDPEVQALVDRELDTNTTGVVSLPFLIFMKLRVYRPKDRTDVVELLKVNADHADEAARYIEKHAPALVSRLAKCIEEAAE